MLPTERRAAGRIARHPTRNSLAYRSAGLRCARSTDAQVPANPRHASHAAGPWPGAARLVAWIGGVTARRGRANLLTGAAADRRRYGVAAAAPLHFYWTRPQLSFSVMWARPCEKGCLSSRIITPTRRWSRRTQSRCASPVSPWTASMRRGHARRSIEITTKSLGIAPAGAPAHARGHPTSIAVRGRGSSRSAAYIAHLTHRCSRRASYGCSGFAAAFYGFARS